MNLLDYLALDERKFIRVAHYKKGTTLFLEGTKCDDLGIVNSGRIEISSNLLDGRKVIYNIIKEAIIISKL